MLYWWQPSVMAILCARALEAGIEVEYVQDLIRKRNLIVEKPLFHLENWPWHLKIYTLGRFLILKDGQPLQFNRKIQQKPLSMLKALIAFGGKGVREDQIMDALWPEADGDMAHQSFATNLHRLRQLFGYEKAIQRQERRLTLDQRYCWVDVWAFDSILEQANAQWKEGKLLDAAQLMEKAIEIYKGPFLAQEIEETWKISLTELLRSKFLRCIEKLGQYWQQTDQWEKALDCYLKGLEVDDLAEEFYQGLMICYHRLGRLTDVLGVYQRYRKTFCTLRLEPSAKIEAIYKSLFSANQGTGEPANNWQDQ
jgi:DNA-binding SARP family transcriptional activator